MTGGREDPQASRRGRATRAGEAWEELPSCTSRWGWMTTSLSSPPPHSAENWGWEGPVSPESSLALRKGGIPAACEPPLPRPCRGSLQASHTYTGEALRPRALLRPRGTGSERSAAVPAPAGIRACSASHPRLPPAGAGGERPARGRGRQCEPGWAREGPGGCWEGLGAAGQAGKSHTRSGSGDAPAAPLLLLDLAADSGPRICIFWHPVEKERRTEPAAFKGTAQAVASPRKAVWGA